MFSSSPSIRDTDRAKASIESHHTEKRFGLPRPLDDCVDCAIDELEVADVGRILDIRKPADRPVIDFAHGSSNDGFFTLPSNSINDFVALLPKPYEFWDE